VTWCRNGAASSPKTNVHHATLTRRSAGNSGLLPCPKQTCDILNGACASQAYKLQPF
jgi:hypothetical protein